LSGTFGRCDVSSMPVDDQEQMIWMEMITTFERLLGQWLDNYYNFSPARCLVDGKFSRLNTTLQKKKKKFLENTSFFFFFFKLIFIYFLNRFDAWISKINFKNKYIMLEYFQTKIKSLKNNLYYNSKHVFNSISSINIYIFKKIVSMSIVLICKR